MGLFFSLIKTRSFADDNLQTVCFSSSLFEDTKSMSTDEQSVLQWHIANLEYGCASDLSKVSLEHWDQDDQFSWEGAFVFLLHTYIYSCDKLTLI